MKTKTKKIRTELIKYSGCRVDVEGRISFVNPNGAFSCIVDISINGEKIKTDHLRFNMKHHLGKGDRIKFKAKIGCYNFQNYGIVEAKTEREYYS